MLFYMCELQSLRHTGQETSAKNCARAKLSLFIILLWSHGVFFNNISKKHKTQWNSREGTANSKPKLTSNWHSRPDTLILSSTAIASLRVRNPRHRSSSETFLLWKFVREPNCSWSGAFVNRGSSVFKEHNRNGGFILLRGEERRCGGSACEYDSNRRLEEAVPAVGTASHSYPYWFKIHRWSVARKIWTVFRINCFSSTDWQRHLLVSRTAELLITQLALTADYGENPSLNNRMAI
jgi:hypothetical protein